MNHQGGPDLWFFIYIEKIFQESTYSMYLKAFKILLLLDKQLIIIYISFQKHLNSLV